MKIEITKVGEKELNAAKSALVELYEAKDEYAKASNHLASIERRMARCFDTINRLLKNANVVDEPSPEEDEKMKSEDVDLSKVGAVCNDCAFTLGFTPKNKLAGVWTGECGICHQRKACTDLHHDWDPPERGLK